MSVFDRAAKVVGDLEHPFYGEERQRDVWNEASAIGFQTMLWAGLALACAMTWIGGKPLIGWAVGLLLIIAAASYLTMIHANRLGVTGLEDDRLNRPRLYLFGLLYLGTVVGMVVRSDTELSLSTLAGAVTGAALVIGIIALLRRSSWARD